jgi:putative nucleotidyltransferase with HDIG domain
MKNLPLKFKIFLACLYLFAISSVLLFVRNGTISTYLPGLTNILFFAILLALTESFKVEYRNIAVSASFAIHLATVMLFKPFAAIIIFVLGFSLRVTKYNGKYIHILNTPIYKTFFNYCVVVIPILYGGWTYTILGGAFTTNNLWNELYLIIVFCIVYFTLNTAIASMLFSFLHNKNIFYFFASNAKLGLLTSAAIAPLGIILAYVFSKYNFIGVFLIFLPIVLARYTFSLYIQSKTQYIQTVDTLMHAMEARDKYTEGHSHRVAEIAAIIARELKYSENSIEKLNMAALLHDVGKIGIDDRILNKPGKLTEQEFEIIKSHPEIGFNILRDIKNLEEILPIIRHHHERFDGRGYPDGKKVEELSLDVFIIQLADTIDAMSTDRPYRKALSQEVIVEEIKNCSGSQFHPKVVEAYLNVLNRQQKAV